MKKEFHLPLKTFYLLESPSYNMRLLRAEKYTLMSRLDAYMDRNKKESNKGRLRVKIKVEKVSIC